VSFTILFHPAQSCLLSKGILIIIKQNLRPESGPNNFLGMGLQAGPGEDMNDGGIGAEIVRAKKGVVEGEVKEAEGKMGI
jgi:hypothetical protein